MSSTDPADSDPVLPGEPGRDAPSLSGFSAEEVEALKTNLMRGVAAMEDATKALHSQQAQNLPRSSILRVFLEPLIATLVALAIAVVTGVINVDLDLPLPANMAAQALARSSILAPSTFAGAHQPTHIITPANTKRLFEGVVDGAEHVDVDEAGVLWMAAENGTIYTARRVCSTCLEFVDPQEEFYLGPGRPLGFAFDHQDGLYVCNSVQGLMHWKRGSPNATLVANRVSHDSPLRPGALITFANSVTVASNGKVYFTSSTDIPPMYGRKGTYETMQSAWLTIMAAHMEGMLHVYDPQTGKTTCLLEGLWFSNGVALSKDEDYLLVVDTGHLQILKYWLSGPKAGKTEIIMEKMPAHPDNLHSHPDGTFWAGYVGGVSPVATKEWIFCNKLARTLVTYLPRWARPSTIKIGGGIHFDGEGRIVKTVLDRKGAVVSGTASGMIVGDNLLIMGNLHHDYISVTDLKAAAVGA